MGFSASLAAVIGDVNGDNECTGSDVTALYNYILYNDASAIVNGDQNGDGEITGSDVTAVYNIILYGPSQEPPEYIDFTVNGVTMRMIYVKGGTFVMGNDAQRYYLQDCYLTINELENITGIDFFPSLDDAFEEEVEDSYRLSDWGLRKR